MYLNDFSVRIPEGKEVSGGYVEMLHGTTYRLVLRNSRNVSCDARVEIDGKHVGTWRIRGIQSITLERPAHDDGQFTFYKLGTRDGDAVELNGHNPSLGLIKVTFTPEKQKTPQRNEVVYRGGVAKGLGTLSAGGTGLSGHSNQQFVDAEYLDLDYSQQTVIHLRLVCNDSGPRPLTRYSTPVPPPVR